MTLRLTESEYAFLMGTGPQPIPAGVGPRHGAAVPSSGVREDLGPTYFRSAWEANYARYLNWQLAHHQIHSWLYEPQTFWFLKIKRGVRSYKPDFKIWDSENSEPYFVEVKGWMDKKSQTKLTRMARYYPAVRVVVVDAASYRGLVRTVAPLIAAWEYPSITL